MSETLLAPISPGELIDKITILRIKTANITDAGKLANVKHELDVLNAARASAVTESEKLGELDAALQAVNEELWKIEDDIRDCERDKDFGETFVALARAVYVTNDKRAALKKEINLLLGSDLVEEKSYAEY